MVKFTKMAVPRLLNKANRNLHEIDAHGKVNNTGVLWTVVSFFTVGVDLVLFG